MLHVESAALPEWNGVRYLPVGQLRENNLEGTLFPGCLFLSTSNRDQEKELGWQQVFVVRFFFFFNLRCVLVLLML